MGRRAGGQARPVPVVRPPARSLRAVVLLLPAVVAASGCSGGAGAEEAEEVARYGPDVSGLVEPGLRVPLGPEPDLRALGVPEGALSLPPPDDGVRRFAFTFEACELRDVVPQVRGGDVRIEVVTDERVDCGQPQYWVSVVDVAPG